MSIMATWLPNALTRFDLAYTLVYDWENRGYPFNPRGGVDHHTAGGAYGNSPSLGIVTNGRSDLPGPLSQTLQGRDNTIYVVAAGKANHAGSGGWNGLVGNSSVWGNERENVGTSAEPWRADQHNHAARLHAAWIWGMAEYEGVFVPVTNVCRHADWTDRKIDTHSYLGELLRADVQAVLDGNDPEPELPYMEDDEMLIIEYAEARYLLTNGRLVHLATVEDINTFTYTATAVGRPPQVWPVTQHQWQRLVAMFGRPWIADASQPTSPYYNGWPVAARNEV